MTALMFAAQNGRVISGVQEVSLGDDPLMLADNPLMVTLRMGRHMKRKVAIKSASGP